MPLEIERKFLVRPGWLPETPGVPYLQGYLTGAGEVTLRVRLAGDKAFLTIKGPPVGISRSEYEYPIPPQDAKEMLATLARGGMVAKYRHHVEYAGKLWEVDVFKGANAGLVMAEIELASPEEEFAIPEWIEREVSDDPSYSNRALASYPWSKRDIGG